MAIEISSDRAVCFKCGRAYGKWQNVFSVSYSASHKGVGHLPVCKECVEKLYNDYLSQYGNSKDAVKQMCRKLDLYWNERLFELAEKRSSARSLMTQYLSKVNSITYAGKCYDDSLSEDNSLCVYSQGMEGDLTSENDSDYIVSQDVINFWGRGYSSDMYSQLEQRRSYYMSKFPDKELDVGAEALIRQICNLEVAIAKDSAAGRSIDKSINSLNTLLGSLNLKPAQRKDNDINEEMLNTPLGVWIYKFEQKRPLPEEKDDDNKIKKYMFTWMGHLCKMLGIKNGYTKLYEDEIDRLKVDKPEYDGDEEDLLIDSYSETDDSGKDSGE